MIGREEPDWEKFLTPNDETLNRWRQSLALVVQRKATQ